MRKGCTVEELGEAFGVTRETIYHWRKAHLEFYDALRAGKMEADAVIEDSLFLRAKGFEYEETKTIAMQDKSGKATIQRIEKTKKYLAPDIRACEMWLQNRNPKDWPGNRKPDITIMDQTVIEDEPMVPFDFALLSKETLHRILEDLEAAEQSESAETIKSICSIEA